MYLERKNALTQNILEMSKSIAISTDGKTLITAGRDQTIKI